MIGPRCAAIVLIDAGVAACGGGLAPVSSPSPPLADAAQVSAVEHRVEDAFGTPALQSLAILAPLLRVDPPMASAPPIRATVVACDRAAGTGSLPLPRSLGPPSSINPPVGSVIPDSLLRRVFVWDSTAQAYQASFDSSGPATGVRFLLYTVGVASPATPLTPVGWLDLSGTGTPLLTVQNHVVNGATPNADYTVTAWGAQHADTGIVAGSVKLGSDVFTFTDSTSHVGSQVEISTSIARGSPGLRILLVATHTALDAYDGFYDFDYTLTQSGETVRVQGHVTTYCLVPVIDGTVSVNGVTFAQVTNQGTVVRPDGESLPADQTQAILDLYYGEERLFGWLAGFYTPTAQFLPP